MFNSSTTLELPESRSPERLARRRTRWISLLLAGGTTSHHQYSARFMSTHC